MNNLLEELNKYLTLTSIRDNLNSELLSQVKAIKKVLKESTK